MSDNRGTVGENISAVVHMVYELLNSISWLDTSSVHQPYALSHLYRYLGRRFAA
jgi:hypothetical protein